MRTELFISEADLVGLSSWKYAVVDNSITTKFLTGYWNWLVSMVPASCAPNVLTLGGAICILQGFLIVQTYLGTYPKLAVSTACALGWTYFSLDAIDGKHARNTRQSSPLGELFDHACDNLSVGWLPIARFFVCLP